LPCARANVIVKFVTIYAPFSDGRRAHREPSHRPVLRSRERRTSDRTSILEATRADDTLLLHGGDALALRLRPPRDATIVARDSPVRRQSATCDCNSTDPETGLVSGLPHTAICVQDIDVQCVLQFTLIHAAGCALHRRTNRVIHRLELSFWFRVRERVFIDGRSPKARPATTIEDGRADRKSVFS
jgi:hypothetical protein